MNFRICKKHCGMKRLEVASFDAEHDTGRSFIRFFMEGSGHNCVFSINGFAFAHVLAERIEKGIERGELEETCGHDFEPAFVTRRHVALLDGVEMVDIDGGFFDGEFFRGCKDCEMHYIDC